jgi:hypothetical protein
MEVPKSSFLLIHVITIKSSNLFLSNQAKALAKFGRSDYGIESLIVHNLRVRITRLLHILPMFHFLLCLETHKIHLFPNLILASGVYWNNIVACEEKNSRSELQESCRWN